MRRAKSESKLKTVRSVSLTVPITTGLIPKQIELHNDANTSETIDSTGLSHHILL